MMKITAEQILSWSPCSEYSEARIREIVGDGLTPQQIAEVEIPHEDRYWALLHLLSPGDLRLLACAVAERALMRHGATDSRSWNAVRVSRLFAMDEVLKDALTEAEYVAWSAAWSAAEWAAWNAARAAARAATRVAAQVAALATVDSTWEDAAWDAAWNTANEAAQAANVQADAANVALVWKAAIDDAMRLFKAAYEGDE